MSSGSEESDGCVGVYFLGGSSSSALELDIVSTGEAENFRSCIFKMMMMKSNKADFIKIYSVTFFGLGYDSDMDSIYMNNNLYITLLLKP